MIVLFKDDPNVLGAVKSTLITCCMQSLLVLIEDIGKKQVREEVKTGEHEEHEEEGIPEADALGGQEYIRIVRSREKNCQVAISISNGAKVGDAFEGRAVEVVAGEDEDKNVGEDSDQNGTRLFQVTEEAQH